MLLRTDVPMPVLDGLRNLTFVSGQARSAGFNNIELRREDVIMGTVVVAAQLAVMPHFGGTPEYTKSITTTFNADGQITATGATDGVAACRFDFSTLELTSSVPRAFLVTLTDSLGRETRYDSGYLVPIAAVPEETPVRRVVISPTELLSVSYGSTVQMGSAAYDVGGVALPGRVVTYSSSNVAIATVDAIGTVTTVGLGDVVITAASGGVQASARLTVVADVFMLSTFTDADGTDLDGWACNTGQLWSVLSGSAEILDGKARITAISTAAVVPCGAADGVFEIDWYAPSSGSGILLRVQDGANYAAFVSALGADYTVHERVVGVLTSLDIAIGPTGGWTDPTRMRFGLAGNTISIYANDEFLGTVSQPTFATEETMGFEGGLVGAEFDNAEFSR